MATCRICGKRKTVGNNVSHANNRTKREIYPNLQKMKVIIDGRSQRAYVCT
nr:50S ribosomal protein L28 [Candidatus Saccharibacteria bacterium]